MLLNKPRSQTLPLMPLADSRGAYKGLLRSWDRRATHGGVGKGAKWAGEADLKALGVL